MIVLRRIVMLLCTLLVAISCFQLYQAERSYRKVKADQMELSHIKYGLFNVDEWKRTIAEIISIKVNEFEITQENRPEFKRKIEGVLEKLVAEIELVLQRENKQRGLKGFLRGMAMDAFDVVDDVKKGIPEYADVLLDHLDDPENREDIRKYLIQRFEEFADKTAGEVDYTEFDRVLNEYEAADKASCLLSIKEQSASLKLRKRNWTIALIASCLLFLGLLWSDKDRRPQEVYLFVVICLSLLFVGITLPMIDIEASISSFSFKLVGEQITFTDQVLFFQSKSIIEVVYLLFSRGEVALMFVAFLIFSFSVLIPVLKLIYSALTIARGSTPRSAFARFLVFKSSKWSMADVMVVAIFMSYIGFNGVINSELTQLKSLSGNVQVFTTNNSTLMIGFYLFTAYCLLGMLLASQLEDQLKRSTEASRSLGE